jgi:hypothetical protein
MRNYFKFFSFGIFAFLLFSEGCKKNDSNITNTVLPDQILYTDLVPDSSATSVRYWIYLIDILPVPDDSSAIIDLDINNDHLMDLRVYVYTSYYWVSNSNPGANYTYGTGLVMLQEKDSVAYSENPGYCIIAKAFKKDSLISVSSKYSEAVATYASGNNWNSPCHCNTFKNDTYFGIKLSVQGGYNYGWILISFDIGSNKVTIKEFAINKTLNNPIRAGQKQ